MTPPPIGSSWIILSPSIMQESPAISNESKSELFINVKEAIECLFFNLKESGIVDRLGNYLGNFSYDPEPVDAESYAKLKKIREAKIPICDKSNALLYELRQGDYINDFHLSLKKTFLSFDKDVKVHTFLRGGAADYIINIFSYIESFVGNHLSHLSPKNKETILAALQYIKAHPVPKKEPHDIDWLDSLSLNSPPKNFQQMIKNLFIQRIAGLSQEKLSFALAKESAFQSLMIPKKKPLFPIPEPCCIAAIGNDKINVDLAAGIFHHPSLFSFDDLGLFTTIDGESLHEIRPQSLCYPFIQVILDKCFKMIRLMPRHEADFRSCLVAIHHLTEGGYLDETQIMLSSIIFSGFCKVIEDPLLNETLYHLILDRFNKHSVNALSYFINLFLYFQVSMPEPMRPFIAELWSKLKKDILEKCRNTMKPCALTKIIFEQLAIATNFEAFGQSLFQLACFLGVSDIKDSDNLNSKCSIALIGTPFFRFQFGDSLIIFPLKYEQLTKPSHPFVFDSFIHVLNPSYLFKNPSEPLIYDWVILHLTHLMTKVSLLSHKKLILMLCIGTKKPFSNLSKDFKLFLKDFLIELIETKDTFPIQHLLAQISPDLFKELVGGIQEEPLELQQLLSSNSSLRFSEQSATQIASFIISTTLAERDLENSFKLYTRIERLLPHSQKLNLFKKILDSYGSQSTTFNKKVLEKLTERIFRDQLHLEIEILISFKRLIEKTIPLNFFHSILIKHQYKICETRDLCCLIFFELFILCKEELKNTDLKTHFFSYFNESEKTEGELFMRGLSHDLFPIHSPLLDLSFEFYKSISIVPANELLKQICNLFQKLSKDSVLQYMKKCLTMCLDSPERFNLCLKTFLNHLKFSDSDLNDLFLNPAINFWPKEHLLECFKISSTLSHFSQASEALLRCFFNQSHSLGLDQFRELAPLSFENLKLWMSQSSISPEDYLKCLEWMLQNCQVDREEDIQSSLWNKILPNVDWNPEIVLSFFESAPLIKSVLQNSRIENWLPLFYPHGLQFTITSRKSNHYETCLFFRTLLKKTQIDDWKFLAILAGDHPELFFSLLDLFPESLETIEKARPILMYLFETSTLSLKDLMVEKMIRLWPDCIDLAFIGQVENPVKLLKNLLTYPSLPLREVARDYLLQKSDKLKTKSFSPLFIFALSSALEDFCDFDLIMQIINMIDPSNLQITQLLRQYQNQLILKAHGSFPFLVNVRTLLSLLNQFEIESSNETQPHLLNLLKKSIRLDRNENTSEWIDFCSTSQTFDRFPSNPEFLDLLINLFTEVKKQRLINSFNPIFKLLKPLLLKYERETRLKNLKSILVGLENTEEEIPRIITWALPLSCDIENLLIDFFVENFKLFFEKWKTQTLLAIAQEIFKYQNLKSKIYPLLLPIVNQLESSKTATSLVNLVIDKEYPHIELLLQLLPKIQNIDKLLLIFDFLKEYVPNRSEEELIQACWEVTLEKLYHKTMEKKVVHKLIPHLDILERHFTPIQRSKKFFLLYRSANGYLRESVEADLPLIKRLLFARREYPPNDSVEREADFAWLNALELSETLLHELFINYFLGISSHLSEFPFTGICELLQKALKKIRIASLSRGTFDLLCERILNTFDSLKDWEKVFAIFLDHPDNGILLHICNMLIVKARKKQFFKQELNNRFLQLIIDRDNCDLHFSVQKQILEDSDVPFEAKLMRTFYARHFVHLTSRALEMKSADEYLISLLAFQPIFLSLEKALWPSLIKILAGYFVTTQSDQEFDQSPSEMLFLKYFYIFLSNQMGLNVSAFDCSYDHVQKAFFELRDKLPKDGLDVLDQQALKFVNVLIAAFYQNTFTSEQFYKFFSFLEGHLSRCLDNQIHLQAHPQLIREVIHAHIAMASSLEDSCLEKIRRLVQKLYQLPSKMNYELLLEAQLLIVDVEVAQPSVKTTFIDVFQKVPKPPEIVVLETIKRLSKSRSAVSLYHMIRALNISISFLSVEKINICHECYQLIFDVFEEIELNDPLFNPCIFALNKRYTQEKIPSFGKENPVVSFCLHKEFFIKLLSFNQTYFGKSNRAKSRGIFLLLVLLEKGLFNGILSHKEYLKHLETIFKWTLVHIEQEPDLITSVFYGHLIQQTANQDQLLNSKILGQWLLMLIKSPDIFLQELGKRYFNLPSTTSILTEEDRLNLLSTLQKIFYNPE